MTPAPRPEAVGATGPDDVRTCLAETMRLDGWPACLVVGRDAAGAIVTHAADDGVRPSANRIDDDSRVRVGSCTKTFTAALLLQLVAEKTLELEASVETYLPGVVRHRELHGRDVTVRQLLQHTSGLPDMSGDVAEHLLPWQHRYLSPRASLDLALTHPMTRRPGQAFRYSNANYVVAGLILEAVSGRPFAEAIQSRILAPLALAHTYVPDQGERVIRGPHPRSYATIAGRSVDYTEFDPSWGFAAGAMVATLPDLVRFFAALARGEVVPSAQLREMRSTVPAAGPGVPDDGALWDGAEYGLGLIPFRLDPGAVAWGNGGSVPGTTCRVAATEDGCAAAVVVTANAPSSASEARLRRLVVTAIGSVRQGSSPERGPSGQ